MKVLHINCNYTTRGLHQTMMEHLDSYTDNNVFVPTNDIRKTVIVPNDNVLISECFNNRDRFFFHRKQKKIIDAIERAYDIQSFDCIHAYTVFTDGNVARYLSRKYNIPYLVTVRNTDINIFFKYMLHLRNKGIEILKESAGIICLSPSYKKMLLDKYVSSKSAECIKKKISIVPNGIDDFWLLNTYKEKPIDLTNSRIAEKELKTIYVGQINKNKNLEESVNAIVELKKQGWSVTFTAIGEVQDEEIFSQLNKYDFFNYNNSVPKEELISFYRSADIFIMPSHTETFGLVYAEAMSQGLPVIYTRGQGLDGQFKDGEVGYSVDDNNPLELAEKILMVCNNYQGLSQSCLKNVSKFNWDIVAREYLNLYHKAEGLSSFR